MIEQKIPFAVALSNAISAKISNNQEQMGKVYPCSVTAVDTVNAIVTVSFQVQLPNGLTIPQVTCPIIGSQYIRIPVQVGDTGICISADSRLGGITGLGTGLSPTVQPGNLGALVFVPIGNVNWASVNPDEIVLAPPGDGAEMTISSTAADYTGAFTANTLSAGNGASGTFTAYSGQTVTVVDGIIVSIV